MESVADRQDTDDPIRQSVYSGDQLDAFRLRSSQMARQVIIDIDIGIDSHRGKVPIPHEES